MKTSFLVLLILGQQAFAGGTTSGVCSTNKVAGANCKLTGTEGCPPGTVCKIKSTTPCVALCFDLKKGTYQPPNPPSVLGSDSVLTE